MQKSIISFLEEQNKYKVKIIESLSGNSWKVSMFWSFLTAYPITERDILRNWVLGGGRAFLSHDAVGSGRIFNGFRWRLCISGNFESETRPRRATLAQLPHANVAGQPHWRPVFPTKKSVASYWDHSNIVPGPEAVVHGLDVKDVQ